MRLPVVIEFSSKDIAEAVKVSDGSTVETNIQINQTSASAIDRFAIMDINNLRNSCGYVSHIYDQALKYVKASRTQQNSKELVASLAQETNTILNQLSREHRFAIVFSNFDIEDLKNGKSLKSNDISSTTDNAKNKYMNVINGPGGYKFVSGLKLENIDSKICEMYGR